MKNLKSFKFKFFASTFFLIILFLSLMYPFISNTIQRIIVQSMNGRAEEIIASVTQAKNERALLQAVKDEAYFVFFHISLIDAKKQLLYDSHQKRLLDLSTLAITDTSAEVQNALKKGIDYSEEFSPLLGQKLIYLAKRFEFQGKSYILRLSFPHEYIYDLKRSFKIGFIVFSSLAFILFSMMTILVLFHFMSPIRTIIKAIKPYQEGRSKFIPEITIHTYFRDEFSDLATTMNSLSERIKKQISSLTDERNEKSAILESLAEGVLAVDNKLEISYANNHALQFLHLERSYIGTPFPSHIHPKCHSLLCKCIDEKKCLNGEVQVFHEGKSQHLNIVASPRVQQGGAILVLQDKSIHYKILEMRKEFIANASHELKTPITIIRGFAETLHDNPHLEPETIKEVTHKIVRNSHRMTKIIQNLLTLSDIEHLPQFRLQPCDLVALVKHIKQTLLNVYPDATIESIQNKEQIIVHADKDLLEVAIMNLVDNGAKYSKGIPHITVFLEEKDSSVTIQVRDKGIGIPKEDAPHIFNRFYTVNKMESKKLGGSGLGLSIVETIIEKHFGSISCSSQLGKGTIFTITLPIQQEKQP